MHLYILLKLQYKCVTFFGVNMPGVYYRDRFRNTSKKWETILLCVCVSGAPIFHPIFIRFFRPPSLHRKMDGGVTGRPETLCPRAMFWDPWDTKWIVPETHCPCIHTLLSFLHHTIRKGQCIMTGIYHCRDVIFPGRFIFVTRGPREFVQRHIISGRPITTPNESFVKSRHC